MAALLASELLKVGQNYAVFFSFSAIELSPAEDEILNEPIFFNFERLSTDQRHCLRSVFFSSVEQFIFSYHANPIHKELNNEKIFHIYPGLCCIELYGFYGTGPGYSNERIH
jgi:hypothetical protein